jgi:hypothetical protein
MAETSKPSLAHARRGTWSCARASEEMARARVCPSTCNNRKVVTFPWKDNPFLKLLHRQVGKRWHLLRTTMAERGKQGRSLNNGMFVSALLFSAIFSLVHHDDELSDDGGFRRFHWGQLTPMVVWQLHHVRFFLSLRRAITYPSAPLVGLSDIKF